jgi:hypothetical protein
MNFGLKPCEHSAGLTRKERRSRTKSVGASDQRLPHLEEGGAHVGVSFRARSNLGVRGSEMRSQIFLVQGWPRQCLRSHARIVGNVDVDDTHGHGQARPMAG